jgi:hypothetical protein
VLIAQRWIVAKLRNRTFFELSELNEAISELVDDMNNRPFSKLSGTRKAAFEELDKPADAPATEGALRALRATFGSGKYRLPRRV